MIWGHGVRGAEQSAATSKACQFAAITSNVLKLNNRKQLKSLTSASLASKSVYQLPARGRGYSPTLCATRVAEESPQGGEGGHANNLTEIGRILRVE
jgi:hypothetical protein